MQIKDLFSRRTVQLSVSTVMELCRGQSGELAVGKEIATGGGKDLATTLGDHFHSLLFGAEGALHTARVQLALIL